MDFAVFFFFRSQKRGELLGIAPVSWKVVYRRGNSTPQGGQRTQRIRCPKSQVLRKWLNRSCFLLNSKLVVNLDGYKFKSCHQNILGHPGFSLFFPHHEGILDLNMSHILGGASNAEAQIEAIEEMEQQDQHHRSAQHCMDGSFLRGVTHGHTQGGLWWTLPGCQSCHVLLDQRIHKTMIKPW